MFQAFVIVLREGFEAFLIVAIIFSYLQRTGRINLLPAVYWGIAASVAGSVGFAMLLERGANEPLWEAVFGFTAAIMVTTFVIQMWREGRYMKKNMEEKLEKIAQRETSALSWWATFVFTFLMICREGMETVLMLIQVPQNEIFAGAAAGILATAWFSFLWARYSQYINVRLFFQVTGIFLLLFVVQILMYSFHELTETGMFPALEVFHEPTELFSPSGLYGKWFPVAMIVVCAFWLVASRFLAKKKIN